MRLDQLTKHELELQNDNTLREEVIIHQIGMIAQHIFGGFFVILGWCFSSSQLFIIGALSEFANECYGVIEWYYYIYLYYVFTIIDLIF